MQYPDGHSCDCPLLTQLTGDVADLTAELVSNAAFGIHIT